MCPPDWITGPDKNKCFRYIGNSQSWDVSEAYCKSLGGHLAALTSFQELSSVQNLCGESNNSCWVGGRGVNSTFGAGWKWSDNTSHWNESIFPNCTNSSCHIKNSVDSCTLVTNGSTFLIGERCNMSHASICMIDIGMPLTYTTVRFLFISITFSCFTLHDFLLPYNSFFSFFPLQTKLLLFMMIFHFPDS